MGPSHSDPRMNYMFYDLYKDKFEETRKVYANVLERLKYRLEHPEPDGNSLRIKFNSYEEVLQKDRDLLYTCEKILYNKNDSPIMF